MDIHYEWTSKCITKPLSECCVTYICTTEAIENNDLCTLNNEFADSAIHSHMWCMTIHTMACILIHHNELS